MFIDRNIKDSLEALVSYPHGWWKFSSSYLIFHYFISLGLRNWEVKNRGNDLIIKCFWKVSQQMFHGLRGRWWCQHRSEAWQLSYPLAEAAAWSSKRNSDFNEHLCWFQSIYNERRFSLGGIQWVRIRRVFSLPFVFGKVLLFVSKAASRM